MFSLYRMTVRQGSITLEYAPWIRISTGAGFLGVIAVAVTGGGIAFFGVVLAASLALLAAYADTWRFEGGGSHDAPSAAPMVRRDQGVVGLRRHREWTADQFDAVVVCAGHGPRRASASTVEIRLRFAATAQLLIVESVSRSLLAQARQRASLIAGTLGLAVEDEVPRVL